MNDASKHNRSTSRSASSRNSANARPTSRTRSGSSKRPSVNPRRTVDGSRRAANRYSASSYIKPRQQAQEFEIAEKRGIKWEVKFILIIVLLLAAIVGAGFVIANMKTQAALSYVPQSSSTSATTQQEPEESDEQKEAADEPSDENESDSAEQADPRDAIFAVDPQRTTWNYDDNSNKVVYLTIDDGPSENTETILDILDRYGVKATFFVIGQNEDYYPMIAEAYKRGHTIGMHTFSHDYSSIYSSADAYFNDLAAIAEVVRNQIGYVPAFLRFPGGSSNTIADSYSNDLMPYLSDAVLEQGYQYYDWNLSFGDGADHTTDDLIAYATKPIESNTIVLLCHDSGAKQTTVEALPAVIEHYQSLGYAFEAITPETWVPHHTID